MTDISLPYDQVCEIIEKTAVAAICGHDKEPESVTRNTLVLIVTRYGHLLWRALEEAHLAKLDQTGEKT